MTTIKLVHFTTTKSESGYIIAAKVGDSESRPLKDRIESAAKAQELGRAYVAGALIAGARVSSSEPPEVRQAV